MDSKRRRVFWAALLLLLLILAGWLGFHLRKTAPAPAAPPAPAMAPVPAAPEARSAAPVARPQRSSASTSSRAAAPSVPARPVTPTAPPEPPPTVAAPAPPPIQLHKELIPKNITIARCYYSQDVVGPGTTIGFDINGSGFTEAFQQMISVQPGGLDIAVKNLRLVTANQIHGEFEIGPDQPTDFIFPQVLIRNLPVFRAPEPFGVVRRGEALSLFFVSLDQTGREGRFRVITHLDEDLLKRFRVEASTAGLEVSPLEPHLPFIVEGMLRIRPGVPPGVFGLAAYLGSRSLIRRDQLIRIVRPNLGGTGLVQNVSAEDRFHRPGDTIQLYLHGSALPPEAGDLVTARVDGFDMGPARFTYLNPAQLKFTFQAPRGSPVGRYGVTILAKGGETLHQEKDVFDIVPPDWVTGLQVTPPVSPGQKSELRVVGRDFSSEFPQALKIEVDEPGIQITNLRRSSPSALVADISVTPQVAPGDYWLHLSAHGKPVEPPFGTIIKVVPTP